MSDTKEMEINTLLLKGVMRRNLSPLTQTDLFKKNPGFQELFAQYIPKVSYDVQLPFASSLVPMYATHKGIWLPGMDVFTEENRSWYGLFGSEETGDISSEIPAALMYPPGTRIDIGLVCFDEKGEFTTTTSAVILKRDPIDSSPLPPVYTDEKGTMIIPPGGVLIKKGEPAPLPLLQIKQEWQDNTGRKSSAFSSSKSYFNSPMEWFQSLEDFSYGIIKVTVPDTRCYKERTRAKLQAALDKIGGTAFHKLLYLQQELKVTDDFRCSLSIRHKYELACVELREYKRQVYAFLHNMDLDDPEQIYAFARRGNIMKRLQHKVNISKWILDRTPEAEKCLGTPVNLRKNGSIGLWFEDPKNGILCPLLALPGNKKIYYKPPVFPKVAEVETALEKIYVTIRGGYLITLNL